MAEVSVPSEQAQAQTQAQASAAISSSATAPIEDAIPIDYVDPTTVLLRRLESWKHVVDLLSNYIEAHQVLYRDHARNYEKIAKTILDAPRFDSVEQGTEVEDRPDHEGISGGFFTLREKTEGLINAAYEAEKSIKSSITPHVDRLVHDVREHIKGLKTNGLKGQKDVEKARSLTQKQIELLGQYTSSFGIFSGKPDPLHDPYIIYRGVLNKLDSQLLKENVQTDSLISIQRDFKTFEAHVVQGIHQTFTLLDQIQTSFWDFQRDSYGAVTSSFTSIPLNFEWEQFFATNTHILADENAPKRTIDRVQFPNQNHESTKTLIEGVIQRKSTIAFSKTYNSAYYVVTSSKFLHQFASKDYVQHPEPELSIYLPDANLGAPYAQETGKNKFKLTGKDALKTISTKHTFEFKTSTYDDLIRWWNVIHDVANASTVTPALSPRSTINSSLASPTIDTAAASAVADTASQVGSPVDVPVAGTNLSSVTAAAEAPAPIQASNAATEEIGATSAAAQLPSDAHEEVFVEASESIPPTPYSAAADPPVQESDVNQQDIWNA
ncbi:hypothetical protein V1514DRAFT_324931 [Lipomyces japonicus]|uniref:uncharacterized protein n=1 Tax=Lipomyces japonicus TaxID=56871 RepID=UPI0034CD4420